MSRPDVDGLNAGYAALVLEQYLDNPAAVPAEWRELFESSPETLLEIQPGLARLVEHLAPVENGNEPVLVAPAEPARPDGELLGRVAAALALVKAFRLVGHLAAHLDPLGAAPPGDPALEPPRLIT